MKTRIITLLTGIALLCGGRTLATNVGVDFVDAAGGSVSRNVDDDDDNEEWDKDQGTMPVEDDDLKKFKVTTSIDDGTLSITVEEGASRVKIWADRKKEKEHGMSWTVANEKILSTTTAPASDDGKEGYFYVEGLENSEDWDDVKIKAKISTQEDTVEFSVVEVDLDVDSMNDNQFELAGFTDEEDKLENSTNDADGFPRPGKIIAPTSHKNVDDDGIPDYADGFALSGAEPLTEPASVTEGLRFIPVQVELKKPFEPDSAKLTFELPSVSSPIIGEDLQLFGEGNEASPKVIGIANGGIRLWKKNAIERTSGEKVPAGDLVPADEEIDWSDLADSGSRTAKLYLEYVEGSPFKLEGVRDIKVTVTDGDVECEDVVKVMFVPVDTDVDSDNDDNKNEPQRTAKEEGFQYASNDTETAHERPGKLLYVHSGDEDYDGIPDYADGFEDKFQAFGLNSSSNGADSGFGVTFVPQASKMVPLIVELPELRYPEERLFVRLEYDDSNPDEIERSTPTGGRVEYKLPEAGNLRVWLKNCYDEEDGLRSVKPVLDGGHFVKAEVDMPMSELRPKLKAATAGGYVLFVESVRKSEEIRDQKITVKVGVTAGASGGGEPQWIYDETVHFTSVEMNLVAISENGDTQRTESYGLSHSSPVISLSQNEVSEPKYNHYEQRWEVDITVAGTIQSDFLDTVREEQGGVIDKVFVYLNNSDDPLPNGTVDVQVTKTADPGSLTKPFPYSGSFAATLSGVPVPDGKNIISVRTQDKVFRADGVVASSFTATFPSEPPPQPPDDGSGNPPPGETGTLVSVTTQHTLELTDGLAGDAVNHVKYTVATDGSITSLFNYEETGEATYIFANPQALPSSVDLQEGLTLDPELPDAIVAVLRDTSGAPLSEILLYETGADTKVFVATFTEWIIDGTGSDPDDPVTITDPVEFYKTDGGEFHPYAFELEGPRDLIVKFEELKFTDPTVFELSGGSASSEFVAKIKEANDKMFLANTVAEDAIGIVAFRENLEGDQFASVSDTIYAAIATLQTGSLYPTNVTDFAKGFGMGLVKGGVEMVGGLGDAVKLGCKAIYEGGKAVVRAQVFQLKCVWKLVTGQKLDQEVRQMRDASDALTEKFEYFKTIQTEGPGAVTAILEGKFERLDRLSGAMKDMVSMGAELFAGLATAVTGDSYTQGIFWGRATFEIAGTFFPITKAGAITKLSFLNKVKASKFFSEGAGLAAYQKAVKVHQALPTTRMCFVAGTMVWTAHGIETIENIRAGDLVWSRSDINPAGIALKPVIGTITTHPESLVEITTDQNHDGQPDDTLKGTGEHPFWVEELKEFVPMGELVPGQTLHLINGTSCSILTTTTLRGPPGSQFTTYNFEVEDFHTYFVGNAGIWVHNRAIRFCEDFEARITNRLGARPRNGNRLTVLSEEFGSTSNLARKADVEFDMNFIMHSESYDELAYYASNPGTSLDVAWSVKQQKTLKRQARFKARGFEVHHLCEKRMSRALGVPDDTEILDSVPGINLPGSPSKMPGDLADRYRSKFGHEPIYHQGPGGLVNAIDQIFTEMGFPPKSSPTGLLPAQKKEMIGRLRILYTETEPFKRMSGWEATRDWLKLTLDNAEIRAYLDNDAPWPIP